MAFVPAENTAQVVISFLSEHGEDAKNVLHFRRSSGPITELQMDGLKAIIEGWLETYWAPGASASWQTDLITIRDLTVQDGPIRQYVLTVNGVDVSGGLPAQNTVAISLRTGLSGPSRRGRVYHVGLRRSETNGSTLTSASTANLVAMYTGLLNELDGTGWTWVVASFRANNAPRTTALLTPITHVILTDPIVDSMDSRKPRDLQ